MTDREQNIIALAEWMGWKKLGKFNYCWNLPDNSYRYHGFNPYESADDCEAVIRKLRGQGWYYHREDWFPRKTMQIFYRSRDTSWRNDSWWGHPDDYKEGVCELALKVKEAVAE